jgi:hypothetical protein
VAVIVTTSFTPLTLGLLLHSSTTPFSIGITPRLGDYQSMSVPSFIIKSCNQSVDLPLTYCYAKDTRCSSLE